MAYKFQRGPAILSGSITVEEGVAVDGQLSASANISASAFYFGPGGRQVISDTGTDFSLLAATTPMAIGSDAGPVILQGVHDFNQTGYSSSVFISASHFIGDGSGLINITSTVGPAGSDTFVQFNQNGTTAGNAGLTYSGTGSLVLSGTTSTDHGIKQDSALIFGALASSASIGYFYDAEVTASALMIAAPHGEVIINATGGTFVMGDNFGVFTANGFSTGDPNTGQPHFGIDEKGIVGLRAVTSSNHPIGQLLIAPQAPNGSGIINLSGSGDSSYQPAAWGGASGTLYGGIAFGPGHNNGFLKTGADISYVRTPAMFGGALSLGMTNITGAVVLQASSSVILQPGSGGALAMFGNSAYNLSGSGTNNLNGAQLNLNALDIRFNNPVSVNDSFRVQSHSGTFNNGIIVGGTGSAMAKFNVPGVFQNQVYLNGVGGNEEQPASFVSFYVSSSAGNGVVGTTGQQVFNQAVSSSGGTGLTASNGQLSLHLLGGGGLALSGSTRTGGLFLSGSDLPGGSLDGIATWYNNTIIFTDLHDGSHNGMKHLTFASMISKSAGSGITATNGVLSADGAAVVVEHTASGTSPGVGALTAGFNYVANNITSSAGSLTLATPVNPTHGDVIHVKARGLTGGAVVNVSSSGLHQIDDSNDDMVIESDFGALSMTYISSSNGRGWRIF